MPAGPVKSVYAEKHAARERVETLLQRLGRTAEETNESVADYLDRWLKGQQLRLAATTHEGYRYAVKRYIIPYVGDRPFRELSTRELNTLYHALAECGGRRGQSLSAGSVQYVRAVIHKAMEDAVREGSLLVNAATRSTSPRRDVDGRVTRFPPKFWSATQLGRFLTQIKGNELEYLLYVMATTGIRRGEALGLRWVDVDIPATALNLRVAMTRGRDGVFRLGPLKTCTPRQVSLPASALEIVRLQRERQRLWQVGMGDAWQNEPGLVFTDRHGSPFNPRRITERFRRLVRRTDLPPIRLHDLRHSHAAILLEAGTHLHVVSQRLGHSTPWMTLTSYAHVGSTEDHAAAARFDALLLGRDGKHSVRE